MKIHYIQHVEFEGPAYIATWAKKNGHEISSTQIYAGQSAPKTDAYDMLVVLGGPMNVYEEKEYPWLVAEKRAIGEAVRAGKKILGVCLGAQLIACVLGAKVRKNEYKEIGWHAVELTREAKGDGMMKNFPAVFTPFHWHGDTFELPDGATHLAWSKGCKNQAFAYGHSVCGLQFHLEADKPYLDSILQGAGQELKDSAGPYVESMDTIHIKTRLSVDQSNSLMRKVIENLVG